MATQCEVDWKEYFFLKKFYHILNKLLKNQNVISIRAYLAYFYDYLSILRFS